MEKEPAGGLIKVVLFGPESTGKTTLAKALAGHYRTPWVPEYARQYLEAKGMLCELSDIEPIARGQIALENQLGSRARQNLLICDTDILETRVYSEAYFGTCPPWLAAETGKRKYDLYLLTGIDVAWEPDLLRDRPHMRQEMWALFHAALEKRGLPYHQLEGSHERRLKMAITFIDRLLEKSNNLSPLQ